MFLLSATRVIISYSSLRFCEPHIRRAFYGILHAINGVKKRWDVSPIFPTSSIILHESAVVSVHLLAVPYFSSVFVPECSSVCTPVPYFSSVFLPECSSVCTPLLYFSSFFVRECSSVWHFLVLPYFSSVFVPECSSVCTPPCRTLFQ